MDSINRNQPEENHLDLFGSVAISKIKELVDKSPTCFFCTAEAKDGPHGARPMNVQQVDDAGNLWFLSADDSHKNLELAADPSVRLYFQGSTHSDFLLINGIATVSRDRAKIDELWNP